MTPKSVVDYAYAFMFACLGFDTLKDAENYNRNSDNHRSDLAMFKTPRTGYVVNEYEQTFDTSLIDYRRFSKTNQVWQTLRRKDTPKPRGSYNVALMFEGPSKVYLADHLCDCCVVWNRTDGKPLQPIWTDGIRSLYAARSGTGVIYARVLRYKNGKPNRIDTYFYAFEFTVMDRDPNKDDMIRITRKAGSTSYSDKIDHPYEPYEDEMDPMIKTMLAQARHGFEKFCKPVDDDTKHRCDYYADQLPKWTASQHDYSSTSYREQIKKMDWRAALDTVQEAWQMKIVVDRHSLAEELWPNYGNYSGSMERRVSTMLSKYQCTPERRKQLREMVDLFVAPTTGAAWTYDD